MTNPPDQTKSRIIALDQFRRECAGEALPLFLEKHDHPFLLLETKEGDFGEAGFQTLASKREERETHEPEKDVGGSTDLDIQLKPRPPATPVAEKHADIARRLDKASSASFVCPLVKRDVNKFASMITLGRAANNDIRINLPSVSKFHAYFTHVSATDTWFVADANSSNGTFVNGERLKSEKNRTRLENGAAIRLGPDVVARFFDARSFHEYLSQKS